MKLSILSKQEEWTWEALQNFIRLDDNAWSAVEPTRGGNSYLVVSRWSQNDKGLSKLEISERREIGIGMASDRKTGSRRGDSKRTWHEGHDSAYRESRVYDGTCHKGDKGRKGSRSSRRGVKYCGYDRDRSLLMDSRKEG